METTETESPDWASNLESYDYQADALTVCYLSLEHELYQLSTAVILCYRQRRFLGPQYHFAIASLPHCPACPSRPTPF